MKRAKGSPSSLNAVLLLVARQSLAPFLLSDGYVESPSRARSSFSTIQFHRQGADHTCLLDFQRDMFWTNNEGKFTVNLGIYFPEIEAVLEAPKCDEIPNSGFWTLQIRLPIVANGTDCWWTLTPKTSLLKLKDELQEQCKRTPGPVGRNAARP